MEGGEYLRWISLTLVFELTGLSPNLLFSMLSCLFLMFHDYKTLCNVDNIRIVLLSSLSVAFFLLLLFLVSVLNNLNLSTLD